MSSTANMSHAGETHPPIVALFSGDDLARAAIEKLGLRLLHFAGPGVAVLAYEPGCSSRLYQAGARVVVC